MSFVVNHAPAVKIGLTLFQAFPKVDPNFRPFGERVLVQLRKAVVKTEAGIELPPEVQRTESSNTQVGMLVDVGSLAFCDRTNGQKWPEGDWTSVGKFVRVPKYGGDRFVVELGDQTQIEFVTLRDTDLLGEVPDPLKVRSFL